MRTRPLVLIKGAGDLASGVAFRLFRAGFPVAMTELAQPLAVRRAVSFAEAVYAGTTEVEGVTAVRAATLAGARAALASGCIPVLVEPDAGTCASLAADVVVDAIMAKTNTGTTLTEAPVVIALGPGFEAGRDCHAVIETHRGHTLGRVLWTGQALPDTGTPGAVEGYTTTRVLRASVAGYVTPLADVGQTVAAGATIAVVSSEPHGRDGVPVVAPFPGVLRGLIHPTLHVPAGLKIGDLDPRGERSHCFTISEKSLAVAGGVLEALLAGSLGHEETKVTKRAKHGSRSNEGDEAREARGAKPAKARR
jgi:xanthine dehydrogenase accessory factor